MKVRSDILRIYQSLHIWTGIISGMVLFIGFYAGSLTMFKDAINQWMTPPSEALAPIATNQYDDLIAQAVAQYPEAAKGFTLNFDHADKAPMEWFEQGSDRELNLAGVVRQASFDQDGQLVSQVAEPSVLADLVDMLHRTAGIFGEVGHEELGVYVLGVASFLYFLAIVSGVIFLLPTLVKTLFSLRQNKTSSRFWLDAHNAVGILSLPFHIVISLTVIVFAFHDQLYDGLEHIVYGEQPLFTRPAPPKVEYILENVPSVAELQNITKTIAPEHQILSMNYGNLTTPRATIRVGVFDDNSTMRGPVHDYVFIQPYSQQILSSTLNPSPEGVWVRTVATFFALHFGSYGGELGRWVYFVLGIMGAFLFYSGNLLWLEKRRNKKGPEQARNVRWMASATVGICLGSMLAVAACFASAKWIKAYTDALNYAHMWVYYAVFFACMISAYLQGAAKSAVTILRLLVITCLAIPANSVIALVLPSLAIWPADSLSDIVLELVAIVLAALFHYFAKQTAKRVKQGEENSVWVTKQSLA